MEYLSEDIDIAILVEKGAHGTSNHGITDTGAGDRAVASKYRIGGLDQLKNLLAALPNAIRGVGGKAEGLSARVTNSAHESNSGRTWSLRNALASFYIDIKVDKDTDITTAKSLLVSTGVSDDSISMSKHDDILKMKFDYLSDGHASNAVDEVRDALTSSGINVVE